MDTWIHGSLFSCIQNISAPANTLPIGLAQGRVYDTIYRNIFLKTACFTFHTHTKIEGVKLAWAYCQNGSGQNSHNDPLRHNWHQWSHLELVNIECPQFTSWMYCLWFKDNNLNTFWTWATYSKKVNALLYKPHPSKCVHEETCILHISVDTLNNKPHSVLLFFKIKKQNYLHAFHVHFPEALSHRVVAHIKIDLTRV